MCGINGIIYFKSYNQNKPTEFFETEIKKMNDAISHRGPDAEGMLIRQPVNFGHRRLSIIDLTEEAGQPMYNEDKSIAIVYNGEIYNYIELTDELKKKGYRFRTRSDTETIIHSYEEYGFDCVNHFNGMWAFAIYDFRKRLLFCSRDRFGVKPFYYYTGKDSFIFSSEIKAILKIKKISSANTGKVFDYITYGYKTSNGETFFQGINELMPGSNLILENDEVKLSRYWQLNEGSADGLNVKEMLEELITDSVRIRYRSDVPVSILLSGGLDSSIIAKVTDDLIDKNKLSNRQVTSYSAIFPGFIYDESKQIKEFIGTCKNIKPEFIQPGYKEIPDIIEEFVSGMGEPVFSATSLIHYFIMKEIRKHNVKVVLNGQGSDEAFFGYDRYIIGYFLLDIILKNPGKLFSQMTSINQKMGFAYSYIAGQIFKAMLTRRYASYLRASQIEKITKVLSNEFRKINYSYFRNEDYKKFSGNNLIEFSKYNINYQGFNQILHYEDHSSMLNSIEIRSPFIDYRIMEFAFSLKTEYKIDNGAAKKILREAFKEKLPESIHANYKKIGFTTPIEKIFSQSSMKEFMNSLFNSDSFNNKKLWDSKKIRSLYEKGKMSSAFPLWRIIVLEIWSKVYRIENL